MILRPNVSWPCATLKSERVAHFVFSFGAAKPKLDTSLAWAQLLLGVCNPKIHYFVNVKTLKVILRPTFSCLRATLKSEWVAHFVFSFGAKAPKLNTPLACVRLS